MPTTHRGGRRGPSSRAASPRSRPPAGRRRRTAPAPAPRSSGRNRERSMPVRTDVMRDGSKRLSRTSCALSASPVTTRCARRALVQPPRRPRVVDGRRHVAGAHDRRHPRDRRACHRHQPRVRGAVRVDDVERGRVLREPPAHLAQTPGLLVRDRQRIGGETARARRGQDVGDVGGHEMHAMAAPLHALHLGEDAQFLAAPADRRLGVENRHRLHTCDHDGA